jgi:putative lipoic acid-binding regulatory protein
MQNVFSLADLNQKMEGHQFVALFMHNPENESSRCAFRSITEANFLSINVSVYIADISQVPGIHAFYKVTSIPSLLLFEKGNLVNVVNGCHESEYLRAIMNNSIQQ